MAEVRYADRELGSIPDLIGNLTEDAEFLNGEFADELGEDRGTTADVDRVFRLPVWFRGVTKSTYDLRPSAARNPRAIEAEPLLMRRFMQYASAEIVDRPTSPWAWLFLMRHYGMPSRLLDWTENPLVGLYFAVTPHSTAERHYEEITRRDTDDAALCVPLLVSWTLRSR